MKLSLAAVALTVLGIPLISTGTNPTYALGWVLFAAGVLGGIAGAVGALVSRRASPWLRAAAFVLGALPPAFALLALYALASFPSD